MRYEPGWTDAQVDGWLGETDRNILLLEDPRRLATGSLEIRR